MKQRLFSIDSFTVLGRVRYSHGMTHQHLVWHVYRLRHAINRDRPFSREAGTGEEHQEIMQAIIDGECVADPL